MRVEDKVEDMYLRLDGFYKMAGITQDELLEKRKNLLVNDLYPGKILIPSFKLFGMDVEFYNGTEVMVVERSDEPTK